MGNVPIAEGIEGRHMERILEAIVNGKNMAEAYS